MDPVTGLLHGFQVAFQPGNLIWCVVGCALGTIVGILPGLGPAATIALLLPLTMNLTPESAIIMLAGIYYGAKYGGSTTSILLNLPGEASSVATCIDGYQMARKGRAGAALGIAAIASFIAGTFGVVALSLVAPIIAENALRFTSPEYFALMCLGLSLVVILSGDSIIKGMLALFAGLWLASIGTDLFTSQSRFTFGQPNLIGGIEFTILAVGVFALGEVLTSLEQGQENRMLPVPRGLRNLLPSWEDLKASWFAFLNGSVVGFLIGVLPGAGASIASFLSYGLEKAVSKHPEKFGTGIPEGVAAPEGANNSDTGGAMVPLLTLGIPGGSTGAILLSALILWGFRPGPLLMDEAPDIFWGLVASMYIGNVVLLVMNLPMVPVFAQILRIKTFVLFPIIFGIAIVGAYSMTRTIFELWLLVGFGALGYAMRKLSFPVAPLVLGFVLGAGMERALRQSLMMSKGDLTFLISRPISATMLGLAGLMLLLPFFRYLVRSVRTARAVG